MKKLLSASWKVLLLTVIYFVISAVIGTLLPLSNDMMAAMTPEDQAVFMPLYLLNILSTMTVMYLALIHLKYRGWKLFLAIWMTFLGLFTLVNAIEMYR